MTSTIYFALGTVMALYTLMHMASMDWFKPSLKEYWLHYVMLLFSVVFVWPVWLVVGFITYIIEIVPKKIG